MAEQDKKKVSQSCYFIKEAVPEIRPGSAERILRDRYTLLSTAKFDNYGIDIYRAFFNSPYSKQYYKQIDKDPIIRLERRHISDFFLTFIKVYVLRSLIGAQPSLTGVVTATVNDLLGSKCDKDALLLLFVKTQVNHLIEKTYRQFFKSKLDLSKYLQSALAIQMETKNVLEQLHKRLEEKDEIRLIRARQFLPQNMEDIAVVRYIKENFKAISNIKVMRKSQKREIYSQFVRMFKNFKMIKISFIAQTEIRQRNYIAMPSLTNEKHPIITEILNYLSKYQKHLTQEQHLRINQEIITLILLQCIAFNKATKRCYPYFSIDHIIFDQKQLKPIISYEPLLLDAIGFVGQTKHLELRLATQPTPKGFDPELSYLQTIQEKMLRIQRKYYYPLKDDDEQTQTIRQQLKLLQEIHVERLIKIFYFIKNGRHLMQDYCSGKIQNQNQDKVSQNKPSALPQKLMTNLISIHNQLKEGTIKFSQIFKMSKKINPKQVKTFQFTIDQLKDVFDINQEEDSLLQGLKLNKTKNYLYERHFIFNEISLILQKGLKKLVNSRRFYIISLSSLYENLHFMKEFQILQSNSLSRQSKHKIGQHIQENLIKRFRNQNTKGFFNRITLLQQIQDKINNVSLYQQFIKRDKLCQNALRKIQQYKTKHGNNRLDIQQNSQYYISLQEIYNGYQNIINKWNRVLAQIEQHQKQTPIQFYNRISEILDQERMNQRKSTQSLRQFMRQLQSSSKKSDTKQIDEQVVAKLKECIKSLISYKIEQSIESLRILLVDFINEYQVNMNIKTKDQYQISKESKNYQYHHELLLLLVNWQLKVNKDNFNRLPLIYRRFTSQNQNKISDNLHIEKKFTDIIFIRKQLQIIINQ